MALTMSFTWDDVKTEENLKKKQKQQQKKQKTKKNCSGVTFLLS